MLVLAVVVIGGGLLWLDVQANPSGAQGPEVIITVPQGDSTSQVASLLQEKKVVGSSLALRIWLVLHGSPTIEVGNYALHQSSSFATVKNELGAGPNVFALSIPPGFTVAEVAQRVGQLPGHNQSAFLALATGGTLHSPYEQPGSNSLEGLLATGTYQVVPGETDTQILTQMIDRFNQVADEVGLTTGAAALGRTPYEVITVASIVEKEGVIQKNLGPVARVIYNRLNDDMPLQMDSTVLYAEHRDGGTVTQQDEQLVTPYNTYLNKGLTPTPICFPSKAALQAALNPPEGSWLYFVVTQENGTESFATTFAEQQANEALAQQRGLP